MNDQDFREKVISELSEIKTEIRISSIERKEIRDEVSKIRDFINRAKGGWFALATISCVVSAATVYLINTFKLFKAP